MPVEVIVKETVIVEGTPEVVERVVTATPSAAEETEADTSKYGGTLTIQAGGMIQFDFAQCAVLGRSPKEHQRANGLPVVLVASVARERRGDSLAGVSRKFAYRRTRRICQPGRSIPLSAGTNQRHARCKQGRK